MVAKGSPYVRRRRRQPRGGASIGGYVGTEDQWARVEKEWNENLDLWGLEEFHLAPLLAGHTSVGRANAELCALSPPAGGVSPGGPFCPFVPFVPPRERPHRPVAWPSRG